MNKNPVAIYLCELQLYSQPCIFVHLKKKAYQKMYLQSTLTLIRFDTVGGTEFAAIHKYAPISSLDILDISNVSPSHSVTVKKKRFSITRKSSIKLFGWLFFYFISLPTSDLFIFTLALSPFFPLNSWEFVNYFLYTVTNITCNISTNIDIGRCIGFVVN